MRRARGAAIASSRNRSSSTSSRFVAMRSAWKTRVAGSLCFSRRGPSTFSTSRLISPVVRIGDVFRASTTVRAIGPAMRSSPHSRKIRVSSSREAVATRSAAVGPSAPMRMSSGPSFMNENPRSARSSCSVETPRSARIAVDAREAETVEMSARRPRGDLPRDDARAERREALFREAQGLRIAVDPHDAHVGRGLEERPRMASEAERRVDVDAAPLRPERRDDLPEQHGDVDPRRRRPWRRQTRWRASSS